MQVGLSPYKQAYLTSMARAGNERGLQILFWNPQIKPAFDMLDEANPDIIIGENFSNRFAQNCQTRLVNLNEFMHGYFDFCDPFIYKKVEPISEYKCDILCIVNYPDLAVDDETLTRMNQLLSEPQTKFHLFQRDKIHSDKWCGWVDESLHSALICSAKEIFPHVGMKYNVSLCGKLPELEVTAQEITGAKHLERLLND
jgi:hypothetical protein